MLAGPLVTVYITNFNYEAYLAQAVESVLGQTFKNFELIIIDDGSTDSSHDVIWKYQNRLNTRVIFQENKGLLASINIAIKAARGKYIMRLDADDYLDPNALLVMTEIMEQNPEAGLVFPDYYYIDENGNITGQERRNNIDKDVSLYDQPAHGACTMFRKKVLIEVNAYSNKHSCQDGYEVWLKIIDKYPVKNINLPLFYYRRHEKNLTNCEDRILNARLDIKRQYAESKNVAELNCIAIVPVRGKIIDYECPSLERLGDYPLLEWTLRAADNVPQIKKAVVSTPDPAVADFIKNRDGAWNIHHRSKQSSVENKPLNKTLEHVLNDIESDFMPDAILQLTPNAPFRSARAIEEAIHTMRLFDVDIVIGVVPDDGQFYWHRGNGLEAVTTLRYDQDLRLERERLYRRTGGMQLINREYLRDKGKIKKPKIGHVVLEQREATNIVDTRTLELAKKQFELLRR